MHSAKQAARLEKPRLLLARTAFITSLAINNCNEEGVILEIGGMFVEDFQAEKKASDVVVRLDSLEKGLQELVDKIEEINDLVLVNKLDLINVVAQMENLKGSYFVQPKVEEKAKGGIFRKAKHEPQAEAQMFAQRDADGEEEQPGRIEQGGQAS